MSCGKETCREAGALVQPGCSMAGYLFQLADMPGDIAVVIFGERDCANAFPRQHTAMARQRPWRIYTAAVREDDAVAGRAEERLADCLRFVAVDAKPAAIVVLTTCLTETIGASPEAICAVVQRETATKIITVHTSGLKLRSQPAISDSLAHLLVSELGSANEPDMRAFNLIGYQTDRPPAPSMRSLRSECSDFFRRLGLELNAAVPLGADLAEWMRLLRGGISVMPERAQFAALANSLSFAGSRIEELPPPIGLAATDAFYTRLAEFAGLDAMPIIEAMPERGEARRYLEVTSSRLSGMKVAYGIGSHHNFRADQMTFEGLAELPMLLELGLDVELVIQERDTLETHERVSSNLTALGIRLPYRLFDEPASLAPVLVQGRYQGAVLSDFLADQAAIARVPFVALGGPWSGYCGIKYACKDIVRAFCGTFARRYWRFL